VAKGEMAKIKDLKKTLKTNDKNEIMRQILDKGEL